MHYHGSTYVNDDIGVTVIHNTYLFGTFDQTKFKSLRAKTRL